MKRTVSSDDYLDKTPLPLLGKTQAYLEKLLQHKAPDSVLSESGHEFYRVYSNLIQQFVNAHGVPQNDVDDYVQEVWRTVAEKLVSFRHPVTRPGLRAWLYTVVHSRAMDLMRKRKRTPTEGLDEAVDLGQLPSDRDLDPASQFEKKWEDATLHTVLNDLQSHISEVNYRILEMRLVKGCDVATVAAKLGLKPEQVRYRQHRMLRKLKARLSVYLGRDFGGDG